MGDMARPRLRSVLRSVQRRGVAVIGLVLCGLMMGGIPAQAANRDRATVSIDGVWCKISALNRDRAFIYGVLTAIRQPGERLIRVETAVADRAEILAADGAGRGHLAVIPVLDLDAHAPTILEPHGTHLILRGLRHGMKIGDTFLVNFVFEKSGIRQASVKILAKPPFDATRPVPKGAILN